MSEARRIAVELMLDRVRDVDWMAIGEYMTYVDESLPDLTEAEFDGLREEIYMSIMSAIVTVSWTQPDGDA